MIRFLFLSLVAVGVGGAFSVQAEDLTTAAPSTALAEKAQCPAPAAVDPAVWKKSLSAGLSFTGGNSSSSVLNVNGALSRDYQNNIWDFGSSYGYGNSKKDAERKTDKNEFLAKAGYKRVFDELLFGGFGADYRHDQVADIAYRLTLSPTIGAFLIRDTDLKLSLEAGPSYIIEETGGEKDNYLAPRVADKLVWDITPTSKLFQSAEALFDVTDSQNFIVNSEVGLESSITTLVSLVLLVRDAYDHQPAIDRKANDVAVISALKLNL